jgi:hypothetical protein
MLTVPEYLSEIVNEEVLRVQKELLRRVSTRFAIPYDQLESMLDQNGQTSQDEKVVVKRVKSAKIISEDERCQARTWSRGQGGQCTRRKGENGLCLQHEKQLKDDGKLKHGWIHEKRPKDTFTIRRPTALHK